MQCCILIVCVDENSLLSRYHHARCQRVELKCLSLPSLSWHNCSWSTVQSNAMWPPAPALWHPAVHCPFFGVNLAPGRQSGVVLQAKIPLSPQRKGVKQVSCGATETCLRPAATSLKCDLCRLRPDSRIAFTSRCDPQRLRRLSDISSPKHSSARSEGTDRGLSKNSTKDTCSGVNLA